MRASQQRHARVYAGTAPTDANAALSGNTVLAQLPMAATAFGAASNGVATADTITPSHRRRHRQPRPSSGSWKRGTTVVVFQGTVGTQRRRAEPASTNIVAGGTVSVTALTYTQAGS